MGRQLQQKRRYVFSMLLIAGCMLQMWHISSAVHATLMQSRAVVPFMHRPFYGGQTISQRTISLFDHDKPWYEQDKIFVRYDGTRLTNAAMANCTANVNCYDGHNGYDLDMHFEPVLSVAAGTVVRAGWYNPLNHNDAFGLWTAVDHHNGFTTVYGHLSALTVASGDPVGVQWQIGTAGTSGSSTGPHLHLGTYMVSNGAWQATDPFGWSGKTADPNIVVDNYLWIDKPGTTGSVPNLSANGSATYPGATVVDDGNRGWSSTGKWIAATPKSAFHGSQHWTSTTTTVPTATATWRPTIPKDGNYEVGVFVDDIHASSSGVPYTVHLANQLGVVDHRVYGDQSHIGIFQGPFGGLNTGPQWIPIGTYYFKAGSASCVMVGNATGVSGEQIAADGVEFVPVA